MYSLYMCPHIYYTLTCAYVACACVPMLLYTSLYMCARILLEAVRVGGNNTVRVFFYFFEAGREAVRVSGGETVTLSLEDVSLVV